MAKMRSVRVRAINLKPGDIIGGQRLTTVQSHIRKVRRKTAYHKAAMYGVVALAPNPDGYRLDVLRFIGDQFVTVKRPRKNMEYAKK